MAGFGQFASMAGNMGGGGGGGGGGMSFAELGGQLGDSIGAMIGQAEAAGDYERAEQLRQLALQQYLGLDAGSPDAPQVGETEFRNAAPDAESVAAQRAALRRMQELALGDGYTVEDRAAIAEATQAANQNEASQRAALMASAEGRGMGGSNAALGQQLMAQQNAANRLGMQSMDISAEGRRRALQALQGLGSLSSGMRGQSYREAADRAAAQDAITRFNTANQMTQQQRYLDNRFRNADALAGAQRDRAGDYERKGDKTVGRYRGYGETAGTVVGKGADEFKEYYTGRSGTYSGRINDDDDDED